MPAWSGVIARISSQVSRTAARHAVSPTSMAPPKVDQEPPRWTCGDLWDSSTHAWPSRATA
jgi:hypothetical protein